jgi:hypothetical protein
MTTLILDELFKEDLPSILAKNISPFSRRCICAIKIWGQTTLL